MAAAGNGTWLVQSAHCETVTEACNQLDWEGTSGAPNIKTVSGLKTAHLISNCPSIHKSSFALSFFDLPKELPGARFESWLKNTLDAITRMGDAFGDRKSVAIVTVPKEESEATNVLLFAIQTRLHYEMGSQPALPPQCTRLLRFACQTSSLQEGDSKSPRAL